MMPWQGPAPCGDQGADAEPRGPEAGWLPGETHSTKNRGQARLPGLLLSPPLETPAQLQLPGTLAQGWGRGQAGRPQEGLCPASLKALCHQQGRDGRGVAGPGWGGGSSGRLPSRKALTQGPWWLCDGLGTELTQAWAPGEKQEAGLEATVRS